MSLYTVTAGGITFTRRKPAAKSTAAIRPRSAGRWSNSGRAHRGLVARRRRGAGRSARSGTPQDRLTKELRLAGIAGGEAANAFIREVYLPAYNARFAVEAAGPGSAFTPIPGVDLDEILCVQEERQGHERQLRLLLIAEIGRSSGA